MKNELAVNAMTSASTRTRADREALEAARRAARQAQYEVQLAAIEVDGAVALGSHIMGRLQSLDDVRRDVSGADPLLGILLADIEATTVRQVKDIQRNLYTQW